MTRFARPALAGVANTATRYVYDGDQRLSQVIRPSGATISYAYDSIRGTPRSVTTAEGTTTLTTDGLGRVIGTSFGGVSTASDFDGAYETSSSISWGGGSAGVTKQYDALGQLTAQTVTAGGSSGVGYSHDSDRNVVNIGQLALTRDATTGFVVSDRLGDITTSYTYNSFGELTAQRAVINGKTVFRQALSRDPLGRIAGLSETVGGVQTARSFGYDRTGRLVTVKEGGVRVASYVYDKNSNRVSGFTRAGTTSASYDGQDRLLSYGGLTFAHDADGQRTAMTDSASGVTTSYGYDSFGRLTSVSRPGLGVAYTLDGLGRRVARSVNGTVVRRYVYDGQLQLVAELDGSGAMLARFVYAPGGTIPLWMEKDGQTYRIFTDQNGSVRLVVNAFCGEVAQRIAYDEYGSSSPTPRPASSPSASRAASPTPTRASSTSRPATTIPAPAAGSPRTRSTSPAATPISTAMSCRTQ